MCKEKTKQAEENTRRECYNIAITITQLEKIIKRSKTNPIDNFLQSEIIRLREKKEEILKNGKS